MTFLSVILPIHNEAENIPELFRELDQTLGTLNRPYELIAIDDGSKDQSALILMEYAKKRSDLKVVFFRKNFGQSAAFDAGFRLAQGEIIVTMDSDLQNDPKDILRMIAYMEKENLDFVTGWRRDRKDDMIFRKIPSLIANWIIRKVTHTKIHDLGCSLKVYRRAITTDLTLYGEMHRFISILAEGLGAKIGELEVNHRPRVAGKSKYGLSRTFKVVLDLLTVWFMQGYQTKPIYIFGGCGMGCIGTGFMLSAVVLYQKYFAEVWVHKNPLFIASTILIVLGVQFLGLGVITEILCRTYFESQKKTPYVINQVLGLEHSKTVSDLNTRRKAGS